MGMRHTILNTLAQHGMLTLDELINHTGEVRKRLSDNLTATAKAGLLTRERDDVTHLPAYKITQAGLAWVKKNAGQEQPDDQPAVSHNTGSAAQERLPATPSPGAAPLQETPSLPMSTMCKDGGDDTVAEALEAGMAADPTAETVTDAPAVAYAWRDAGAAINCHTPLQLVEWLATMRHNQANTEAAVAMMQSVIDAKSADVASLTAERDAIKWDAAITEGQRNEWRQVAAYCECTTPSELMGAIQELEAQNTTLKSRNTAIGDELSQLWRDAEQCPPPRFYASTSSTGGLKRHARRESAEARAVSLVRKGDDEALVLVPISRATRGAVLKAL